MGVDVFQELIDRLELLEKAYEEQVEEDLERVDIRDTVIADSLRNQIELQLTWEELYVEVNYVCQALEDQCEEMFSIASKELLSDSYKKLNVTEAKLYAQSDAEYVKTKRVKNRADTLRAKVNVIVEALKTRRWILKSICDVLEHGNDQYLI